MKTNRSILSYLSILAIVVIFSSCSEGSFLTSNKYKLNRVAVDHSKLKIEDKIQPTSQVISNTIVAQSTTNEVVSTEPTSASNPIVIKKNTVKVVKQLKESLTNQVKTSNATTAKIVSKPSKPAINQNKSIRNSIHNITEMTTGSLILLILLILLIFSLLGYLNLINELIGLALLILLIILILYLLNAL